LPGRCSGKETLGQFPRPPVCRWVSPSDVLRRHRDNSGRAPVLARAPHFNGGGVAKYEIANNLGGIGLGVVTMSDVDWLALWVEFAQATDNKQIEVAERIVYFDGRLDFTEVSRSTLLSAARQIIKRAS
jgi:hypothetical protein